MNGVNGVNGMDSRVRAAALVQESGDAALFYFIFKGMFFFYVVAVLAHQVLR